MTGTSSAYGMYLMLKQKHIVGIPTQLRGLRDRRDYSALIRVRYHATERGVFLKA